MNSIRPHIGNMLWRIGDLLDFGQQLAWTRDAGFDGVGFHASAGVPEQWCGIEPRACDAQERKRLRRELAAFSYSEIHAPFAIELRTENLPSAIAALAPVLELAGDLGAAVVTVHAHPPGPDTAGDPSAWLGPMRELDAQAAQAGTVVALESVDGFDTVSAWGLPNIGVNLDVGHMYHSPANRRTLDRFGGIGNLIRHLGGGLAHLHLHDVQDSVDHIEIGTGIVEFGDMAAALSDIGYPHGMTLEMNPERCPPDGILRSAEYLRACFREGSAA